MSARLGLVSLVIALLAASGLYVMKDRVQPARGRAARGQQAAIAAEQSALNRLRAEWAMLNQPGRLARLAADHLAAAAGAARPDRRRSPTCRCAPTSSSRNARCARCCRPGGEVAAPAQAAERLVCRAAGLPLAQDARA